MYDVTIVGAGVIGCAVAFELSKYKLNILVLEKENDAAMGATRANSAIIHAGFDPEPDTLMAKLNVQGSRMAKELCEKLSVPYINNGALVLGFDEQDRATLNRLLDRGIKNGVEGLEIISGEQARKIEPHVSAEVTCALNAPTSAIVDPWEYALAFAETAAVNGAKFRFNSEVVSIESIKDAYSISLKDGGIVESRYVINCAGVNSDKLHDMVADNKFNIIPTRGDYFVLDKSENLRASRTLFQCPSKVGKGVLVSPTVHGNLLVGPNAVKCENRSRVNTTREGLDFVRQAALRSVPDIDFRATIRSYAGMRANSDFSDFIIEFAKERFLDIAGIKSPGLSAAPAIALMARQMLGDAGLELIPNPNATDRRVKLRFKHLSPEEKQAAIEKNPLYGRIICRCETISEAEIVAAIHSPLKPRTVDGIKRRANSGMGRCQGGFCSPRVVEIIARELNISPLDVLKDGTGSYILDGITKDGGR